MPDAKLPDCVETVFLDAGNTLISMDYPRIATALNELGVICGAASVHRAEAASRPMVSRALQQRLESTEHEDTFRFYVETTLGHLGVAGDRGIVDGLLAAIRPREGSRELWCLVLPGVQEALIALRRRGLRLVVVSNSDGTVEAGLQQMGLRDLVDQVFDSRCVGVEKPDPQIFQQALDASGSDPATTIHVGDLYSVDVLGARRAAISPVLLDPFDDWGPVDCAKYTDLTALERALAAR